jgi:hypothetical protein
MSAKSATGNGVFVLSGFCDTKVTNKTNENWKIGKLETNVEFDAQPTSG